jgi:signal transduction histidine kinase/CheY-like chemotaxis protein
MAISRSARAAEDSLEQEVAVLELLQRTALTIAAKLDVTSVVQTAVDAAADLAGAQLGALFYIHGGQERAAYARDAQTGQPREAFAAPRGVRAVPLLAQTFARGETVLRGDLDEADRPPGAAIRSYLAVPLILRSGDLVGGIFVASLAAGAFDDRTRRIVAGIAAQTAIALDNARLHEETRRASEERARQLDRERAARTELEQIVRRKDELLGVLSHELRAPLNAILGWAEILIARNAGADQRGLEAIGRNARAQAQLIEDLLDLNRIVAGKLRLELKRTDLVAAVHAAIEDLRPLAEAKQLQLTAAFDPPQLVCDADPQRLRQVVWNLLSNAIKYTPARGAIEVAARAADERVELTVRDTGVGIQPEHLPHLFDRGGAGQVGHHGGLGLGLAIVKPLVELHGGAIEADSAGPGQGATFTVRLPVRVADAVAPVPVVPAPRARSEVSLAGVRVLVIDDDGDARELVEAVLGDARAETITAASADEGLAMVRELRPDVIVSDIGMSLRDGYQFIRLVRTMPAASGGRTPALALTAFVQSEDRARALLAGYQEHVAKPVEAHQLVAAVHRLATGGPGMVP